MAAWGPGGVLGRQRHTVSQLRKLIIVILQLETGRLRELEQLPRDHPVAEPGSEAWALLKPDLELPSANWMEPLLCILSSAASSLLAPPQGSHTFSSNCSPVPGAPPPWLGASPQPHWPFSSSVPQTGLVLSYHLAFAFAAPSAQNTLPFLLVIFPLLQVSARLSLLRDALLPP